MQTMFPPIARIDNVSIATYSYSTEQAAAILLIKPQTMRAALCRDGHYFGVRPIKLPSRFLAWPADEIDHLASRQVFN